MRFRLQGQIRVSLGDGSTSSQITREPFTVSPGPQSITERNNTMSSRQHQPKSPTLGARLTIDCFVGDDGHRGAKWIQEVSLSLQLASIGVRASTNVAALAFLDTNYTHITQSDLWKRKS